MSIRLIIGTLLSELPMAPLSVERIVAINCGESMEAKWNE
jgi:hypothetical protein